MIDISQKLAEAGINPKHLGDGNQKLKCPQCQPPHNPRDNPLSVTIEGNTVVWKCHHCEWTGGSGDGSNTFRRNEWVRPKVPENPIQDNFVADYFQKRGISKKVIDAFKIYNENNWIAFPYFDKDGTIANVKYRTTNKEFRQAAKAKKILYNYENIHDQEEVIFVEGEMDCLSLAQVGFKNVTTLSDGASSTVSTDPNDSRFKGLGNSPIVADKVILFCDDDEAGRALKESLLYRVGKDKAWYVNLSKYGDCKDANDVLCKHGEQALKDLVDGAIPYPVEGLYKASDYSNEIMDLYEGRYVKPIEIGMEGLDEIYKIQKGTFHCITGIPNHGKSLMLSSILIKLAEKHGWRFCVFSPEHSTAMHIRRLLQLYIGKGFDETLNERMTPEDVIRGMKFIDEHFYFIETRDAIPSVDLIMKTAKNFVYKYGAAAQGVGLVIDPYNEVDANRKQGKREDEHIRDFISECKKFCRMHNAVVWCVAHPTKLPRETNGGYSPPDSYSISGSSHWSNMADCILTVHRDFDAGSTSILTRKIREQDLYGKIGEAKFQYDFRTYNFKKYEDIYDSYDDWSK